MTIEEINPRIDYWKEVLQIEHVRVESSLEECDDPQQAYATCWPHRHYDSTKIIFRSHLFASSSERSLDEVVVHELLHFMFRDFDSAARSVEDELGRATEDVWHERLSHEEERLVDKLANLIVSLGTP